MFMFQHHTKLDFMRRILENMRALWENPFPQTLTPQQGEQFNNMEKPFKATLVLINKNNYCRQRQKNI